MVVWGWYCVEVGAFGVGEEGRVAFWVGLCCAGGWRHASLRWDWCSEVGAAVLVWGGIGGRCWRVSLQSSAGIGEVLEGLAPVLYGDGGGNGGARARTRNH